MQHFALANKELSLLYILNKEHHIEKDMYLCVWTGDGKFKLDWISPETGEILKTEKLETRSQVLHLTSPLIKTDALCRIRKE
jgi:hypothetical protein